MTSEYISVKEAAEYCEVSEGTIYFWIKNKDYFKTKRIGWRFRIDKKSFLKWLGE